MATIEDIYAGADVATLSSGLADTVSDSKINKLDLLQQKSQEKLNRLAPGVQKTTLRGMEDSDTFKVDAFKNRIRESDTEGGLRYDALEVPHGDGSLLSDIQGLAYGKSDYALQKQDEQIARDLGYKYTNQVTDQDRLDDGNRVTIQKLADAVRSPGEERWIAPLIRGLDAPTDLSGNWDDKGLNIPVGVKADGVDSNGRPLASIHNLETGDDVTRMHAIDPSLNAFAPVNDGVYVDEETGKFAVDEQPKTMDFGDQALNALKGGAVAFYDEGVSKPAAFVKDALGINEESEEDRQARVDNLFGMGYDRDYAEAMGARRAQLGKDVFDETKSIRERVGAGLDVVADAVTDMGLITSSLGTMAAWFLPGAAATKLTKGKKTFDAIDRMIKSGKLTRAQGVAAKAKVATTTKKGLVTSLASQTGQISASLGNLNQQYAEYVKNNNGVEPEEGKGQWIATRLPMQMFNQNLDKITDMSIIKSPKVLEGIKQVIGGASNKQMGKMATGVAKTLGSVAFVQMPKEAAQEYTQQMMEAFNTRYGTETFKDVDTFKDFILDERNHTEAVMAGLEGMGGAGQFAAVGAMPKGIGQTLSVGKEHLDNYLGTAESENKGKAISQAGRKNKFETIVGQDAKDLDIEESVKGDWVDDISKYASELWLSEDLKKDTEYSKKPTQIIDDTVEAIAKIKNVKSEEGKDLIRTGLFKRFFDESNAVDETTGESKPISPEQKTGMLKVFLDKFKGNKQVEHEAERQYEEVLKTKFSEIQERLRTEGVNVDADFSSKGALTETEMKSLESILSNMKVMGSEPLTELADKVSQIMTKRQELLGSEGGENGPTKKDFKEVRKEIEELGFLLKGPNYKSIKQHKRDLEDYLTVEGADKASGDEAMSDIARFVKSRNGKIQMFDKSGDTEKLRSVGAIKFFAQTTLDDTRNMNAMLKDVFPKLKDESVKQVFLGMTATLDDVEANLKSVVNEEDGAKIYEALAATSNLTNPEKELLDKTLRDYHEGANDVDMTPTDFEGPVEEESNNEVKIPTIGSNLKAFIKKELAKVSKDELMARLDTNDTMSPERRKIVADYIRGLDEVKIEKPTEELDTLEGADTTLAPENELEDTKVDKSTSKKGVQGNLDLDIYSKEQLNEVSQLLKSYKSELKDYLPLRHGNKVNADIRAFENIAKNQYTKKDIKRIQDLVDLAKSVKSDPDIASQVWRIEPEVNTEAKPVITEDPEAASGTNVEPEEEGTSSTDTVEEPKEEEKPTEYSKEDIQFMQTMLDDSEQELEHMRGEIGKAINATAEAEGTVKNVGKEVGKAKDAKKDANERIQELYEDIEAHDKLIKDLLKDKNSKLNKKRALVTKIKEYESKLDRLKKRLESLQSKRDMKEDKKLTAIGKIKQALTDLVNRFNLVLNKMQRRIMEMVEAKLIKQKEANELQKEVDGLVKQIEAVEASKEATYDKVKEVLPEYRNLVTDYKRALNDLDKAKEVRDDLLGKEGFNKETLADYKAQYKDLKITIKGLKKDIATSFRLDIQEAVGDVAASNESNRRSLTNRLYFSSDIMEIMPKIIKTSEKGEEKVAKALDTFEKFESTRGALINQDIGNEKNPEKEVLKKLGLDKLFTDKTIANKVKKAMNVTSILTLSDMVSMRSMPGDMLKSSVEGAFGNVWSYADADRKDGEVDWLVNQVRQGKIVPIATFAESAGRRLLEELEVKLDTDTMQDRTDATRLLGELVINNILPAAGQNKGTDPRKGIVARDNVTGPLQVKTAYTKAGGNLPSIRVLDISMLQENTEQGVQEGLTRQDIQEAGSVFEYASETTDGMISFSPLTHEKGKRGRNSDVIITDAEIAYLNAQGSKEWKFDPSFKNIWEEQAGKDLQKLKEMLIGTKEELIASTHVMEVESALAKYTAQELDLERMIMAYELAGDKPFYIGWDYTVSNRNMMNNKMLNPQNSKFSRFIVSMKDMVNDVTADDYIDVMLGISQAFDLDPDKQTDDNAIEELRTGKDIKVDMVEKEGKLVIKGLSENLQNIIDDTNISVEKIRKELNPGSDHLMHVYQALDLLQKVQNGSKLRTNLALEGDGITNGMATTTTQIGMNEETKAYYEKMGMYTNESEFKNHGQFKESGGKDIYQTPEDAIIEELNQQLVGGEVVEKDKESALAKAVKSLVPKDSAGKTKWRGFLKPLVMVFIYGAGIQNISMNGSRSLAASMVKDENIENGSQLLEAMNVFINQRQVGEVITAEAKNNKSTTSDALKMVREGLRAANKVRYDLETGRMVPDRNGQMYVDQNVLNAMATVINASVGTALDGAFNKAFAPITKYRKVLKTVNEMNYLAFTVAFNKKLKDKFGATRLAELSKEQLTELKDEMVEEGTYYGSTNMHGGTQDYFKTQQDTEYASDTIEVKLSSLFATYQSHTGNAQTINQVIKTIASNVGAVGVIDVHSVDGGTMIKGHIKDVLNIFDALVLGTNGKLNNEQMREINDAYYKINMEHSILGKAVEKLVKNADSLKEFESETDAQIAKDLIADMKRIMGPEFNVNDLNAALGNLMSDIEEIHDSRNNLWNTDMRIKQYYVADRHDAAVWDQKARDEAIKNGNDSRIGVFAKDKKVSKKERKTLGDMLAIFEDILRRADTTTAKAKTKSNIAIIPEIDDILSRIEDEKVKEHMKKWFKEEAKKYENIEEGCM